MAEKSLIFVFGANTSKFFSELKKVEKGFKGINKLGQSMKSVGQTLTLGLTLPIVGAGVAVSKAAIDFESSFAGIRKTMNLTEAEFDQLAQSNRDLAKEIPVSVNELNRIGELAGQLGINGVDNVLKFEKTIAALSVTTDLTADSAALSFAQIANIMQLPQDQIDRLGSAVVGLGNNFATVESMIVDFTQRIAGAGKIAGLSAGDITGISTAFASLGIGAEAGGTAVQKVLLSMVAAVSKGGDELASFAATAGVSAGEFQRMFREDAAGAFVAFVEGLGLQGDKAIATLDELGLGDERLRSAFLATAGAGDLLSRAVAQGNLEFEKNTALTDEARKRYETVASQLQILWNRLMDVAITIGQQLLPVLTKLIDDAEPFFQWVERTAKGFADLDPGMQKFILALAGIAAATGPVLFFLGAATLGVTGLTAVFTAMNIATGGILIAIGALVVAGLYLATNWDKVKSLFGFLQPLFDIFRDSFDRLKASIGPIIDSAKRLWESLEPVRIVLAILAAFVAGAFVAQMIAMAAVINGVIAAIGPLVNAFLNLLDVVANVIGAIMDILRGDWSGAMDHWNQATESSIQLFQNLWFGAANFFIGIINGIVGGLNLLIEGYNKIRGANIGLIHTIDLLGEKVVETTSKLRDNQISVTDLGVETENLKTRFDFLGPSVDKGSDSANNFGSALGGAKSAVDQMASAIDNLKLKQDILRATEELQIAKLGDAAAAMQTTKIETDSLTAQLAVQDQIVAMLSDQYNQMAAMKGVASEASMKLQLQLLQEEKALADLEKQLKDTQKAAKSLYTSSYGGEVAINAAAAAALRDRDFRKTGKIHGMATGGVISETIAGVGLASGHRYMFGERGPETVTPGVGGMGGGVTIVVNQNAPVFGMLDLDDHIWQSLTDGVRAGKGRGFFGNA